MNKLLILLMFSLVGCAYKPLLQKGRCYSIVVHSVDNTRAATELSTFKIEDILDSGDSRRYILRNLSPGVSTDEVYYAQAKVFDRHLGSVAELFWIQSESDTCGGEISKEEYEADHNRPSPSRMRRAL